MKPHEKWCASGRRILLDPGPSGREAQKRKRRNVTKSEIRRQFLSEVADTLDFSDDLMPFEFDDDSQEALAWIEIRDDLCRELRERAEEPTKRIKRLAKTLHASFAKRGQFSQARSRK